ncbi:phosphotransferase [Desulfovibrio sp. OttesenSCG-928-C06]|nr:phosphotransferase [Desulfovibrio sp. OttesenSCG-928-C06]
MRQDTLRKPAHAGLFPSRVLFSPVGAELSARFAELTGLKNHAWETMLAGDAPQRFFRGMKAGRGVFLKLIPSTHLEQHIFANRIAAWSASSGAPVLVMLPGYPVSFDAVHALCAYEWFNGEYFAVGSETQLMALADGLGVMHRSLASLPDIQLIKDNNSAFIQKMRETHAALASGDARACIEPAKVREVIRSFSLDDFDGLSAPSPLHGDVNPGNVLFSENGLKILDFEDSHFYFFPPELELSFVLERFALIHGNGTTGVLDAFVAKYADSGGSVSKLSTKQLIHCLRLLRIIALCRLQSAKIDDEREWSKMLLLWDWISLCESKKQWFPLYDSSRCT